MSRRACLAIGVANVLPTDPLAEAQFANLDGAPQAAQSIGQWAVGWAGPGNVQVVTDGAFGAKPAQPVTAQRVRDAVDALFPDGSEQVEHLLLTFCGHGMTGSQVGSTFWLFSDALQQGYRVNVDAFNGSLLTRGVKRISLISDACRDAPVTLDLLRLEAIRVLVQKSSKTRSPMFDRLAACQDGKKTYMLTDNTSANPGKSILSGVVLDVLWGNEPSAFEGDVITTTRFGGFTRDRARERADEYVLPLEPFCMVDPTPALLVRKDSSSAVPQPPLEPWPPVPASTATVKLGFNDSNDSSVHFSRLLKSKKFRVGMLGRKFGFNHPDLDVANFPGLPDDARELVDELVELRTGSINADAFTTKRRIDSTISTLEGMAAVRARTAAADSLRASLDIQQPSPETNLEVLGMKVANVWSHIPTFNVDAGGTDDLRSSLGVKWDRELGTPLLVEFDDHKFAPAYAYPNLSSIVVRNKSGVAAIAYAGEPEMFAHSKSAIDELTQGVLDAKRIAFLAARIRQNKHSNPVLGVIAAYLYRSLSDVDNIRRIAYYYVENSQPVPFDVALLGDMIVEEIDGAYRVRVPAVPRAVVENDLQNSLPDFALTDTPAVVGLVAGRCPWMTVGWDYPPGDMFHDLEYRSALRDGLVRTSTFTLLKRAAGMRLAKKWKLPR